MRNYAMAMVLGAGLAIGSVAVQAKLPAPPPMSDAEKAAKAEKAAAAKAKAAELNNKYMEKAVANYQKNKAAGMTGSSMSGKK